MLDRLQRPLRDLRISVTDRCNFRCDYCMPADVYGPGHVFLPRTELLSFEEITRLARLAAEAGVRKIRLTGGEPLLRRDLPKLVEMLAAIEGIDDLALTTNGSLLAARAQALADAGLQRVTVSLDALDDTTFAAIGGTRLPVSRVLEGIAAAAEAGLAPLKINMVVRRGVNEHAILELAEFCRTAGHTLRCIEFMDVGTTNHWQLQQVMPSAEVRDLIGARWPLEAVGAAYPGEVAARYRYLDGAGEIGLISSVTQPFCGACSRARLSADGKLYTCLFADTGHDLRDLVRSGATDEALAERLGRIWGSRTDRYSELRAVESAVTVRDKVEMSYIGG